MTREEALKQVEEMLKKMDSSTSDITTESLECIIASVRVNIIDELYRISALDYIENTEFSISYDGRVELDDAEIDINGLFNDNILDANILDAVIQDIQDNDFEIKVAFTDGQLADQRKVKRDAEVSEFVRKEEEGKDYSDMPSEAIANSRLQNRIVALRDKLVFGIDEDAIREQIGQYEIAITTNIETMKERIEKESSVEFHTNSLETLRIDFNDQKDNLANSQMRINEIEATLKIIQGSIEATTELLEKAKATARVQRSQ